jgi:hypothetical protein
MEHEDNPKFTCKLEHASHAGTSESNYDTNSYDVILIADGWHL